jgi:hypothetical protein
MKTEKLRYDMLIHVVVLLFSGVCVPTESAHASSCAKPPLRISYQEADVIAVVQAANDPVRRTERRLGRDFPADDNSAFQEIKVLKTLKGDAGAHPKLFVKPYYGDLSYPVADGETALDKGKEYLLYLSRNKDGSYSASLTYCGGSGLLSKKAADLEWLQAVRDTGDTAAGAKALNLAYDRTSDPTTKSDIEHELAGDLTYGEKYWHKVYASPKGDPAQTNKSNTKN